MTRNKRRRVRRMKREGSGRVEIVKVCLYPTKHHGVYTTHKWVADKSYPTVRWGWIPSYDGSELVKNTTGKWVLRIGYGPEGTAEWVSRRGYIQEVLEDSPGFWNLAAVFARRDHGMPFEARTLSPSNARRLAISYMAK